MNKNDLIKTLYEQGKITFDEAMTLASKELVNNNMSLVDDVQEDQATHNKKLIDDLIFKMTVTNIDHDLGDEDYAFDVDKVVSFMDAEDWLWRGKVVTAEMFREELQSLLRDVVEKTVDDYVSGRYKDESENSDSFPGYHSTSCGGIEVASWINTEYDLIEAEAKFVAEEAFESMELKDLK